MKTKVAKQILLGSILFAGLAVTDVSIVKASETTTSIVLSETEIPMPSIEDQVLCGPGGVSLHVSNVALGDAFKWFTQDANLIEGENQSFLELPYIGGSKKFGVRRVTTEGTSRMTWVNVFVEEVPEPPGIILIGDAEFCDGETIELRSTFEENNLWSTGEITQSIFVSQTGTYSVQQTSEFCISEPSEAVSILVHEIPSQPIISASGATEFCEGESVVLSSSYTDGNLWSTGETSQSITVSTSGTYSVSVVENGCESEISEEVSTVLHELPDVPEVSVIGANPFCEGSGLRLVTSVSENFVWSTGETTRTIIVSEPGTYFLTVFTDNCELNSEDILVEEFVMPAPLFISEVSEGLSSSYSSGNQWYKDNEVIYGATGQNYVPTEDGDYFVQIIFENGCAFESETVSVNITEAPDVSLGQNETVLSSIDMYPNPSQGYLHINGVENATIVMYDITGRMVLNAYRYNGKDALDINKLCSGVYMVLIKDGSLNTTRRFIVE